MLRIAPASAVGFPRDLPDPLASAHHLVGGCGAVETRARVESEALRFLVFRARLPSVLDRLLERAIGIRVSTPSEVHVPQKPVRPGEPEVVPEVLQNRDHAAEGRSASSDRCSGSVDSFSSNETIRTCASSPRSPIAFARSTASASIFFGTGELTRLHQDLPELGDQREPRVPRAGADRRHARAGSRPRTCPPARGTSADRSEGPTGAIDQPRPVRSSGWPSSVRYRAACSR